MNATLLMQSLQVAVPLWCYNYRGRDPKWLQNQAVECGQYLANHGDELQFKVPGKTTEVFNRTAEGIACAVLLVPEGITFLGVTFTSPIPVAKPVEVKGPRDLIEWLLDQQRDGS